MQRDTFTTTTHGVAFRGPRDYIIHPNEYDLGTVIADIDEIRRYNQQRFEMEQLTAIVHEDEDRGSVLGTKTQQRMNSGHGDISRMFR